MFVNTLTHEVYNFDAADNDSDKCMDDGPPEIHLHPVCSNAQLAAFVKLMHDEFSYDKYDDFFPQSGVLEPVPSPNPIPYPNIQHVPMFQTREHIVEVPQIIPNPVLAPVLSPEDHAVKKVRFDCLVNPEETSSAEVDFETSV